MYWGWDLGRGDILLQQIIKANDHLYAAAAIVANVRRLTSVGELEFRLPGASTQ